MEVRIDKDELDALRDDAMMLDALKQMGVRKWRLYNEAIHLYHRWKEESNEERDDS